MKKGQKASDEAKAKMSESARDPDVIAKKTTPETNEKRSSSEFGLKRNSALQKQKSSEKLKENQSKLSPEERSKRASKAAANIAPKRELNRAIQATMLDYLRGALLEGNYYQEYIKSFLDEAKKDPNSVASRMLASGLFNEKMLDKLDGEANKMMARDKEFLRYRIRQTLYDKQQEVFDNRFDKEIEVICTRRAGKTELNARLVVEDVINNDDHHAVYINRTFDNAVGQLGKPLTGLLDSLGVKYYGSPGSGLITLDNGSDIRFGGFNNKGELDKLRGFKFSRAVIDEVAHLRNVKGLIEEILEPAMIDYGKSSQIFLTGTPPRIKKCFAYEAWHNPKIKHYHWSFMDNPFIPDKENVIKSYCERHGVTEQSLVVQREFYGNMEAFDEDAVVFKGYKTFDNLPIRPEQIRKAWVGVDWGFEDDAAVVSIVSDGKIAYVIDAWVKNHTTVTEKLDEVKRQYSVLKNLNNSVRVQVITDTNEKDLAYELQVTYKIPDVCLAYKYDKILGIDQLADWLRAGTFCVKDSLKDVTDECENTVWKRDADTDELLHEIDDDIFHPNAMWAIVYVSRQFAYECLNITDTNKAAKPI